MMTDALLGQLERVPLQVLVLGAVVSLLILAAGVIARMVRRYVR